MRIIGGRLRGKKLFFVCDEKTRPTPDRVKENVFNILCARGFDFTRARVLDFFAGTGQMGVECFSRGATDITFNDTRRECVDIITKNCTAVGLRPKIAQPTGQYDLIFLDPPFAVTDGVQNAINELETGDHIAKNAIIVAETETPDLDFGAGMAVDKRKYGRETIYILSNTLN